MGFLSGLVEFVGFAVSDLVGAAAKRGNAAYKGTSRQGEWEAKRDAGLSAAHDFRDKMNGYSNEIKKGKIARRNKGGIYVSTCSA